MEGEGPVRVSCEGLREGRVRHPHRAPGPFLAISLTQGHGLGPLVCQVSCSEILLALPRRGSSGVGNSGRWRCPRAGQRGQRVESFTELKNL